MRYCNYLAVPALFLIGLALTVESKGLDHWKLGRVPCETRGFTSDGEVIYVLDSCGTVLWLNPNSGDVSTLVPGTQRGSAYEIAADNKNIALLGKKRRTIRLLDKRGTQTTSFEHVGESHAMTLELWGDRVAVASFYDAHVLFLYSLKGDLLERMIPLESYDPTMTPSIPAYTSMTTTSKGELLVFDLFSFRLTIVEEDGKGGFKVSEVQSPYHPYYESYIPPPLRPKPEGSRTTQFGGALFGLSTATAGESLLVLMVSRDGSGAKEITYGGIRAGKWNGAIDLAGTGAEPSTAICTVGNRVYVLERDSNYVYHTKVR